MSDQQKIWTFGEMYAKVRADADLEEEDPDEQFVTKDEMIGFFNEAIDHAESEILTLGEDYFLTSDYVPLVTGQSEYDMPSNIYANKLRAVIYNDGSLVYEVRKFGKYKKFLDIAEKENTGTGEQYRRFLKNAAPGQVKMVLVPASRETTALPLTTGSMKRWYIRNANRIPILGEYINNYDRVMAETSVDTGNDEIHTNTSTKPISTGDRVKITSTGTMPGGLTSGQVYYASMLGGFLALSTSLANAQAGTKVSITSTGTGILNIALAATESLIDATVIDIPEFSTFVMEWVKANCLFKDGDPRLAGSVAKIQQQLNLMKDTLAEAEPDDDNELPGDYSFHDELS